MIAVNEESVVVFGKVAWLLEKYTNVGKLRVHIRGRDPDTSDVLLRLRCLAMAWDESASAVGTAVDESPEPKPRLNLFTPSQAADLIGITDRAIRKAITEGRLPGHKVGNGWQIYREDLEHYRAARAARKE
jgi:excisionase family DNA binding protein